MKKNSTFICLFLLLTVLHMFAAQSLFANQRKIPVLSEKARFSLLTLDPGRAVYLAFGHTALRLRDEENKLDIIYNYGIFSFDDPFFIPRFLYGELDYKVESFPFRFYAAHDLRTQNRIWYEQELNLTQNECNRLYRFLEWNILPENETYRYDFIKDNCATRVRDAIENCTDINISYADWSPGNTPLTYRMLIDEKLQARPLWQFAIDFLLGSASDREMNTRETMFIPEYLMRIVETATIQHGDTKEQLAGKKKICIRPTVASKYDSSALNPAYLLWPLAIMTLVWTVIRSRKRVRCSNIGEHKTRNSGDFILFFTIGFLGCLVGYLTFFSSHSATKGNYNLVWLWPTHLICSLFIVLQKKFSWLKYYWRATAVSCIVPLIFWPIWPQHMNTTMIPLMLILATRALSLGMQTNHEPIRQKSD